MTIGKRMRGNGVVGNRPEKHNVKHCFWWRDTELRQRWPIIKQHVVVLYTITNRAYSNIVKNASSWQFLNLKRLFPIFRTWNCLSLDLLQKRGIPRLFPGSQWSNEGENKLVSLMCCPGGPRSKYEEVRN